MSLDHGEDFTLLDAIINTLPTRAGSPHSATSRRRVSIVPVQPKTEIAPGTRPVKENNAVTAIPKKMPKREQDNDDDSKLAVDLANLIEAEKEADRVEAAIKKEQPDILNTSSGKIFYCITRIVFSTFFRQACQVACRNFEL